MSNNPEFIPISPERQEANAGDKSTPYKEPSTSRQSIAPRKFIRLLEESSNPIYLLDSKDRIRFVNQKLAAFLNVDSLDLLGIECNQRIPGDNHPNREICSLLSLPATSATDATMHSIACLPLPQDNTRVLDRWTAVIVVPMSSEMVSKAKPDKSLSGRSSFRLCVWVSSESSLTSALSSAREWVDQSLIQSVLYDHRKKQSKLDDLVSLIGSSAASRLAMSQIQAAITLDAGILLFGPTGSELERIAKSIFEHRRRRHGHSLHSVFTLPIECRLMDKLLMSEMLEVAISHLDGSSHGSSHGIDPSRKSTTLPKAAKSIGETQVNLLLEGLDKLGTDAIEPLMLFLNRHPQVGVIATVYKQESMHTSSSLPPELHSNLMSQIGILQIKIPSLQDRVEDLPILAEQILEQLRQSAGISNIRTLSPAFRRWIQSYSWPGNYSELYQALSNAVATSKEVQLQPHDLPLAIRTFSSHDLKKNASPDLDLDQALENYERSILKRALAAHESNRAAAARSLGISRTRFLRRLEQLNIDGPTINEDVPKSELVESPQHNRVTEIPKQKTKPTIPVNFDMATPLQAGIQRESIGNANANPAGHVESSDDQDLPIFESID